MRLLRVGVLLLVAGCSVDLPVPGNAQLLCGADEPCPSGFVCRETLGRCIPLDQATIEPPSLASSPTVAPALGTVGTEFRVETRVTGELLEPPTLTADFGGSRVDLELVESPSAGHYIHHYVVSGSEPQGTVTLFAKLVGKSGDVVAGIPAGQFRLDFDLPKLVPGSVTLRRTDGLAASETDGGLLLSAASPVDPTGVAARISFVVDEPLAADPVVLVGASAAEKESVQGLAYVYRYRARGDEAQSATPVVANVKDAAGNEAPLALGSLIFDFTPPGAFDTAKLTYRRSPTEFAFQIEGSAGAAPDACLIRVYATASATPISAQVPVADNGAVPVMIAPGDLPTVFVSQIDRAGNEGARFEVKRIEWQATFAQKVSGDFQNPHVAVFGDVVGQAQSTEAWGELTQPDYQAMLSTDGGWSASGDIPRWYERVMPVASYPGWRGRAPMIYDTVRATSVLFGGLTFSGTTDQTWEWSGRRWTNVRVAAPPPRLDHAMAYDARRGRTVLFGGVPSQTGAPLGDTWVYDGRWRQLFPPTSPSPTMDHSMAYDAARDRIIVFGGYRGGVRSNETWEFDGVTWKKLSPAASPPGRTGAAMAYDPVRSRIVLFGGVSTAYASDTWEWDGQTWTEVGISSAQKPAARQAAGLVYDVAGSRMLLYGGASSLQYSDMWKWDGAEWTPITVSGAGPGQRSSMPLSYDTARSRVVLFTGVGAGAADHWEFDGSRWFIIAPNRGPLVSGASGNSMPTPVYDTGRNRIQIFKSVGGSLGEVWEWDGSDWSQQSTIGGPPTMPSNFSYSIAYDATRGRTVYCGGPYSGGEQTWEWSADAGEWTQPTATQQCLGGGAMAYDSARGVTVMGRGIWNGTAPHTAEWTGSTWTISDAGTAPDGRVLHAMAYDKARSAMVLFGGEAYLPSGGGATLGDTWLLGANGWTAPALSTSPEPRKEFGLAWDDARSKVVLFGGFGARSYDDTWEWDGSSWRKLQGVMPPTATSSVRMAYDRQRSRMVATLNNGTLWERAGNALPSLTFYVSAQGVLSVDTTGPGAIEELAINALAGGSASGADGVVAEVWDRSLANGLGAWRALFCVASCSSSGASPSAASWRLQSSAGSLDGVLLGDRVILRLRPAGLLDEPRTALSVSGVRASVVYRRP